MKLHCKIVIYDRTLSVDRKSRRCILAFVKDSAKSKDVCFCLWTRENKQGTKYKVTNNIANIFGKFLADGKVTISLNEPCHDLIIQSDAIQLKNFVNTLRCIRSGRYSRYTNKCVLRSNATFNQSEFYSLEKVVIKKKSEYPVLQGFPQTTTQLVLSGLDRKSFDRQILTLQKLRCLDLSNNKISFLPKELGNLPLQTLDLSRNNLGKSVGSKWAWLEKTSLRSNLCYLDISDNLLTQLPIQIGWLKVLRELKIRKNKLTELPQTIGCLNKLQFLDVADNNLLFLPGTIQHLRLQTFDVTDNDFHLCHNIKMNEEMNSEITDIRLLSLLEISARSVLKLRITYDESLIPYTLVQYLNEAKYCFCKQACFDHYSKATTPLQLYKFSISMKTKLCQPCKYVYYFCSLKCHNYYATRLKLL